MSFVIGINVGIGLGRGVGLRVVGRGVGLRVVGRGVGLGVGRGVGIGVGRGVGIGVGGGVGLRVGLDVGLWVGRSVGLWVGRSVGIEVGRSVGSGATHFLARHLYPRVAQSMSEQQKLFLPQFLAQIEHRFRVHSFTVVQILCCLTSFLHEAVQLFFGWGLALTESNKHRRNRISALQQTIARQLMY